MKKRLLLGFVLCTALLLPCARQAQDTPTAQFTQADQEQIHQKEYEMAQRAPAVAEPTSFTPQQLADIQWILTYTFPKEDALYGKPVLDVTAVTVEDGSLVFHLEPTPANPILQAKSEAEAAEMIRSQVDTWQQLRFRYRWLLHLHYLPVTPTTIHIETTARIYAKPTDMEYIIGKAYGLIVPPKKKIQVMVHLQWPGITKLTPPKGSI